MRSVTQSAGSAGQFLTVQFASIPSARVSRSTDALLAWSFAVARREAGHSRGKLALIAEVERGVGEARHLRSRIRAIALALRLSA